MNDRCSHGSVSAESRGEVLDFVMVGSGLSLRSFQRIGGSISMLDFAHLGSPQHCSPDVISPPPNPDANRVSRGENEQQ